LTKKAAERKCFAVVKVRGTISAQREARETLELLRLARTNHAVLVDNRPSFMGMLYRVQNYVTWGEVSKETVALMLKKRGKLAGGKKHTACFQVASSKQGLQRKNQEKLSCRWRSRLPRRSHKRPNKTHGLVLRSHAPKELGSQSRIKI